MRHNKSSSSPDKLACNWFLLLSVTSYVPTDEMVKLLIARALIKCTQPLSENIYSSYLDFVQFCMLRCCLKTTIGFGQEILPTQILCRAC